MNPVEQFAKQFTNLKLKNVVHRGTSFYQIPAPLHELAKKMPEVYSAGRFLGEKKRKTFKPSLALLELIAKSSDKKCYVNEKGAWLFLCKRDLLPASIKKNRVEKGLVLIQTEQDENIGLGEISTQDNKLMIKNILDRGNFLRRETNTKNKSVKKKTR